MTGTMWNDMQQALAEAHFLALQGKTGDRNDEQRRLAILATKIEDAIA